MQKNKKETAENKKQKINNRNPRKRNNRKKENRCWVGPTPPPRVRRPVGADPVGGEELLKSYISP
jgi:hypothetical protein